MSKWVKLSIAVTSLALAANALFAPIALAGKAGATDVCAPQVTALRLAMGDGEGAYLYSEKTGQAAEELKSCKEKNGQEVTKGLLDVIQKSRASTKPAPQ